MPPELADVAGIFTGDTAEAFGLMQYAVIRDPGRLEFARRVMTEAMLHLVDHFTAASASSKTRPKAEEELNGRD